MLKFPMYFEVESKGSSGIKTKWNSTAESLDPIQCAVPPEFAGPGGGYTPEDLFALSVLNCMIATFKVYAEKFGVEFQEIKGKAKLTVDMQQNLLSMPHMEISIDVSGAKDVEKTKKILEQAVKDCAVSNSVKSEKTLHLNVS